MRQFYAAYTTEVMGITARSINQRPCCIPTAIINKAHKTFGMNVPAGHHRVEHSRKPLERFGEDIFFIIAWNNNRKNRMRNHRHKTAKHARREKKKSINKNTAKPLHYTEVPAETL